MCAYCFERDYSDQTLGHVPDFKAAIDETVRTAATVVVVGWRSQDSTYALFEWLDSIGPKTVALIDAWKPNLDAFDGHPRVLKVHTDVRYCWGRLPDWMVRPKCLIWQDGPEHLTMAEASHTIAHLQLLFDSIVIATPDGPLEQGALYGNPYEEHKSAWTKDDYERLGFSVVTYSAGLIGLWRKVF